jgi:hypothetical protein
MIQNLKQYIFNFEVLPFHHKCCLQTLAWCTDIRKCSFSASEWIGVSLGLLPYISASMSGKSDFGQVVFIFNFNSVFINKIKPVLLGVEISSPHSSNYLICSPLSLSYRDKCNFMNSPTGNYVVILATISCCDYNNSWIIKACIINVSFHVNWNSFVFRSRSHSILFFHSYLFITLQQMYLWTFSHWMNSFT